MKKVILFVLFSTFIYAETPEEFAKKIQGYACAGNFTAFKKEIHIKKMAEALEEEANEQYMTVEDVQSSFQEQAKYFADDFKKGKKGYICNAKPEADEDLIIFPANSEKTENYTIDYSFTIVISKEEEKIFIVNFFFGAGG